MNSDSTLTVSRIPCQLMSCKSMATPLISSSLASGNTLEASQSTALFVSSDTGTSAIASTMLGKLPVIPTSSFSASSVRAIFCKTCLPISSKLFRLISTFSGLLARCPPSSPWSPALSPPSSCALYSVLLSASSTPYPGTISVPPAPNLPQDE